MKTDATYANKNKFKNITRFVSFKSSKNLQIKKILNFKSYFYVPVIM